jgi:hypothetical protein
MGLGGLVTGIMGVTGNSPTIGTPNVGQYGPDYNALLGSYIGSQGSIYGNEARFGPAYTRLGLQEQGIARGGQIGQALQFGPQLAQSLAQYDPSAAGLLGDLGTQARVQLGQNGALDPGVRRMVEQSTRGAQAARGLGYGPGDAAQEQFYLTQTQEQRRAANQAFAGQVAQEQQQFYRDPYSIMGAMSPIANTPNLISPQQSDSMLGTTYNASAATNIANQNAKLAMLQGFNAFS